MTTSLQAGYEPSHTPSSTGPHLRLRLSGPPPAGGPLHLSYGLRSFPLLTVEETAEGDLLIALPHPALHAGQFFPGKTLGLLHNGRLTGRAAVQQVLHPALERWPAQVSRQASNFNAEVLECCCLNLELDLITAPFIRDFTLFRNRGTGGLTIRVQTHHPFITSEEACRLAEFLAASEYPATYLRTEYRQLTDSLIDGLVIHFSLQQEDASLRGRIVVN